MSKRSIEDKVLIKKLSSIVVTNLVSKVSPDYGVREEGGNLRDPGKEVAQ